LKDVFEMQFVFEQLHAFDAVFFKHFVTFPFPFFLFLFSNVFSVRFQSKQEFSTLN